MLKFKRIESKQAQPDFSVVPVLCWMLCVIIGSVVFVSGAFLVQGVGVDKLYGLNTTL